MLPREHYLKQPFTGLAQLPATHTLTPAQLRLLKKHGTLITALLGDEVLNPSLEDMRLVKVLRQECAPTTPVELAWLKFQSLLSTASTLRKSA